jgi:ABC-type multidrug transport system permease subunit
MASSLSFFLFIYAFIVSFNRSNSLRKTFKNLNILLAAPEAGTNFNSFKFDLWVSKKSALILKSFQKVLESLKDLRARPASF